RVVVVSTDAQSGAQGTGQAPGTRAVYTDFVIQDNSGWFADQTSEDDVSPTVTPPSLVCASTQKGTDSLGDYSILYGRVRVPDVASVEVKFSGGVILTDTTGDGIFAVMVPSLQEPSNLRLLDANGKTLHMVSMPTPFSIRGMPMGGSSSGG